MCKFFDGRYTDEAWDFYTMFAVWMLKEHGLSNSEWISNKRFAAIQSMIGGEL